MELSKMQLDILHKTDRKIVVMASAASGKTALMTEKLRQIINSGINPYEIAAITFTNMAAEEMRRRLGNDYRPGVFIGTIHALANYCLLSSGIDTSKYLNDEDFDKLFTLVRKNPECIKKFSFVLLDEAQDTGDKEFKFIFDMINPPNFFVCGDLKQSIYSFKGANPDLFRNLSMQRGVATYDLNQNYRNGYNILQYAKKLVRPTGLLDNSVSMCHYNGNVTEIEFSLSKIKDYIINDPEYHNWAILTRTNADIDTISNFLETNNIPYDTFKQGNLTKEQLADKLNENTVKVLTIHSAKGLEWKNVIVMGTRFYPIEERNVCYVAATRAKERLIWMTKKKKKKNNIVRWE